MAQDVDRIQNGPSWSSFRPRRQRPLLSCGAHTYSRAKHEGKVPQALEQPCPVSLTEQGDVPFPSDLAAALQGGTQV